MSETFDVIIAGAGIIGAACAAECVRGGLKTLVLDRGVLAGGTTSAGMGHIVLMDDSPAQFALTEYSRRLWLQARDELPDDVEYEVCGTLWVAADDEEMAEARRKAQYFADRQIRVELLDGEGARRAEPNLRPGLAGGLRVVDDGVLFPPCAARFFMDEALRRGSEFRPNCTVKEFLPEGGVTLVDGSRISAGRSVNAAGPWSPELMPGVPVRKRKGHLVITDPHPGFVHQQIVELGYLKSAHSINKDSVAFNIQPRRSGQLLIGSSRQFDAAGTEVDHEILNRMLARAAEYMPSLEKISDGRVWTGHRATTPDKLPLIGPSIAHNRIWLATGHEGLGITTSLGTGRLLADMLLGRKPEIPAEAYAPGRFA
ncbi:MAG TPA: FAD-dependent oxidoreductase [Verrucomicrobiae bacterium]|nr:FAD-dependent oxidoreductase [Verrucomicrobiae bacterium]